MALKFRINSLAVLVLAALFYWFFMSTKHDPRLASANPFAEDPYDAVGSFCMILSMLLAILSSIRAFLTYRSDSPFTLASLFLARTQIAVPIGILIALACDAIAMARHPNKWMGTPVTVELLLLMVCVAVASLALIFLVRRSLPPRPAIRASTRSAILLTAACCLILAIFPESLIQTTALHFVTIVFAFILIAAPQAAITMALLPIDPAESLTPNLGFARQSRPWLQWTAIVLLGIAVGAIALAGEFFGESNGGPPAARILIVSAVFLGAGTSFALVSFAFFKGPLGLFREWPSTRITTELHS